MEIIVNLWPYWQCWFKRIICSKCHDHRRPNLRYSLETLNNIYISGSSRENFVIDTQSTVKIVNISMTSSKKFILWGQLISRLGFHVYQCCFLLGRGVALRFQFRSSPATPITIEGFADTFGVLRQLIQQFAFSFLNIKRFANFSVIWRWRNYRET